MVMKEQRDSSAGVQRKPLRPAGRGERLAETGLRQCLGGGRVQLCRIACLTGQRCKTGGLGAGTQNHETNLRQDLQGQAAVVGPDRAGQPPVGMQPDRRGLALAQGPGGIGQQATVGIGQDLDVQTAPAGQLDIKKGRAAAIAQRARLPRLDGGLRLQDHVLFQTARGQAARALPPGVDDHGRADRAIGGALDPGDHRQSEIALGRDGGKGEIAFADLGAHAGPGCTAGLARVESCGHLVHEGSVPEFRSDRCRVGLRRAPRHARPALCPGPGYSPMAGRDTRSPAPMDSAPRAAAKARMARRLIAQADKAYQPGPIVLLPASCQYGRLVGPVWAVIHAPTHPSHM